MSVRVQEGHPLCPFRYVARCRSDLMLYGSNFEQEGDIDSWLEFALHEASESRESREYVVRV